MKKWLIVLCCIVLAGAVAFVTVVNNKQGQIDTLNKDLSDVQAENNSLKEKGEADAKTIQDLNQQVTDLTSERDALTEENGRLTENLNSLTSNLTASQQKMQGILYIMTDGAQGSIESVLSPYMKIYADVAVDSPYFDAVDYVSEHKLMDARGEETFGAAEAATLGEMAEGLYRIQGLTGTQEDAVAALLETEKAWIAAQTPTEEPVAEETVTEEAPAEEAAAEDHTAEEGVTEEAPAEATAEEVPEAEKPAAEAATEEAPVAEMPVEETVTEAPADEEAATEEGPAEASAEEVPEAEKPAEEAVTEEAPVAEAPAEEAVTEEAPAEEAVTEEVPAAEAPAEETAAEEPAVIEDASTELTKERMFALCKAICGDKELPEIVLPNAEAAEATRGDLAMVLQALDQMK